MKSLLGSLFSLLTLSLASGLFAENANRSDHLEINTMSQPTIGYPKAKVHVVAFLEPKCPDSKRYNNEVFPRIEKEFINTNKILYTVIPVSFLPNSMPAAIALLCVYNQDAEYPNRDLFFKYLNYIYQNQPPEHENWATIDTLQKFAANASPAIRVERLRECIEQEHYRVQIEKNTEYGNQIMDNRLSTPSIFVDGVKVENADDTISYESLRKAIQESLQKKNSSS